MPEESNACQILEKFDGNAIKVDDLKGVVYTIIIE